MQELHAPALAGRGALGVRVGHRHANDEREEWLDHVPWRDADPRGVIERIHHRRRPVERLEPREAERPRDEAEHHEPAESIEPFGAGGYIARRTRLGTKRRGVFDRERTR